MLQKLNDPAILVCAYNRPHALARLLTSLSNAVYNTNTISLIISIDKSDSDDVYEIAEQFNWKQGTKKVIHHPAHLGLKAHLLSCGDLTETYGSLIILEDDLFVSPYFYEYARQAHAEYNNKPGIAGISLYNYQFSESSFYKFAAVDDGTDVYFMQVASSLGQLWTNNQWQAFKAWFGTHAELPQDATIPAYLQQWGPHSWKKHFTHYLADTNNYVVYPRVSLTTPLNGQGTNTSDGTPFNAPLQLSEKHYSFCTLENSGACYDAWFEILPECLNRYNDNLKSYDYAVDLHGTKAIGTLNSEYVLTSQKANNAVFYFGSELIPFELNVAMALAGNSIGLYKIKGNVFEQKKLASRNILEEQKKHDALGISVIIPVQEENTEAVMATLKSLADQNCINKECVLVSNSALSKELKKTIYALGLRVKVVRPIQQLTLERLVAYGFKNANKGILVWIAPGNIFTPSALHQVQSILSSNLSISWVRGINEDPARIKVLNVRNYRLAPGEAYRRLEAGTLKVSMEQDFFRKHCMNTDSGVSFSELFFHCIQTYQLYIVVSKLGIKVQEEQALSSSERRQLLKKYIHLKEKKNFFVFFADRFLTLCFPNSGISQWFYPVIRKFPGVLRYDALHGTFYTDRY
ncbi:hypothetical protein CNR22_04055 [Sphingobacteriaceae bacterium]|nr:hypothetical protein CNR22_04055 [Sphingobacteriaceae bacterium]